MEYVYANITMVIMNFSMFIHKNFYLLLFLCLIKKNVHEILRCIIYSKIQYGFFLGIRTLLRFCFLRKLRFIQLRNLRFFQLEQNMSLKACLKVLRLFFPHVLLLFTLIRIIKHISLFCYQNIFSFFLQYHS